MVEKAYSKINITLDVKDLRDDGYHNIESVILPLEFHDTLEVSILPKSTPDDFVVCDDFSLRIAKYNLVHKTIDLCRAKWGFKERLNVNIHKNNIRAIFFCKINSNICTCCCSYYIIAAFKHD